MLNFLRLNSSNYVSQIWKNGKGRTLEIAVDSQSPYRWRVSTADLVESGEFSTFPDYQRTLVLLSGSVRLASENVPPVQLSLFEPFSFSGDALTMCEVIERGRDLNVFCLNGNATSSCHPTWFRKDEEIHFPLRGSEHFLFLIKGELEMFERNTQQQRTLVPQDTARFTRPQSEEFLDIKVIARSDSQAIWVVIHL